MYTSDRIIITTVKAKTKDKKYENLALTHLIPHNELIEKLSQPAQLTN